MTPGTTVPLKDPTLSLARDHWSPFKPILACSAGVLAWDTQWPLLAVLAFVFVWALWTAKSRFEFGVISFWYFAGALWPVPRAANAFFHEPSSGIPIYLGAIFLSMVPFVIAALLFWGKRGIMVSMAVMGHAALFGLASPLTAGAIVVSTFMHNPEPPKGWVAVDTSFGGDGGSDFAKIKWMQDYALSHEGSFFVFPEGVIREWPGGEWISRQLAESGKTLIFGAYSPITATEWKNEVIFSGEYQGEYDQRISLPVGFKPNPMGHPVVELGPNRVGIVLCFEQTLPFVLIESLSYRPSVLIAPSNLNWADSISEVDWVEERSVTAWSKIFQIPVLRAVNR